MDRIRVFLVDDNRAFLEAAAHLLADDPMIDVVETFGSPKEAMDRISVLRPDIVLVELEMPEMSGLLVTLLVKAMLHGPKVIIVSDNDQPIYQNLTRNVHADAFISKRDFCKVAATTVKQLFTSHSPCASGPTSSSLFNKVPI
jgi:DNA-binding NarL/FixJ family response regulator